MKKIILSAICVIASLTFATTKAQMIDEFPYNTGNITSMLQLDEGWTYYMVSASTGGIFFSGSASYMTSPELKGSRMTVSAIIPAADAYAHLALDYSYDGKSFTRLTDDFFYTTTNVNGSNSATVSKELPFGVKYFRIQGTSTSGIACYIRSISITNNVSPLSNICKNLTWTLSGVTGNVEMNVSGTGTMPDFVNHQDSIPWYKHREGITKLTIGSGITSIGNNAFRGMKNLKDIVIPENITRIEDYAFYECAGPTSLYIPNTVTSIGTAAFYSMTNLDYVELGTGLKSVGDLAFAYCTKLTSLRFNATDCRTFGFDEADHLASQPSSVFYGNVALRTYLFGSNVKTIPDYMFAGLTMGFRLFWQSGQNVEGYDDVNTIAIPPTIKKIGKGAFYDSRFMLIDIPSSVDTIGAEAFRNITTLQELSCERATPPVLAGGLVFHNIDKGDCLLIVPSSSYNAYAAAVQWKDFMFIVDPSYNNSALRALAVNGSEVDDFESGVYNYSITVPYSVSSITLNAEAAAAGSMVEGVGTFDLNVGLNVFVITVTAADGVSTTTYTMGVTRENMPVGVEELASASGGLSFNNPVRDGVLRLFDFDGSKAVEIYDLNGRKMYENRSGSDVIDVSGFACGVYVVKNGKQVAKLVKQ